MAEIHIRGRSEALTVSNEKARRIKTLRFGDPQKKILPERPDTLVDLGDWSGELRKITAIDLDRREVPVEQVQKSELDAIELALKKFKTKKLKIGRVITAGEQYMASLGIIRIDSTWGDIVIRDPSAYKILSSRIDMVKERAARREYGKVKGLEALE